jgi:hypothetical protein
MVKNDLSNETLLEEKEKMYRGNKDEILFLRVKI